MHHLYDCSISSSLPCSTIRAVALFTAHENLAVVGEDTGDTLFFLDRFDLDVERRVLLGRRDRGERTLRRNRTWTDRASEYHRS